MSHVIASVSMLSSVEKCSTEAWLKTQGLYPKADESRMFRLFAGIAIHEVMHLWLRKASDDECMGKLVELYRPYSDKFLESNHAYHCSNIERIIAYWLSQHPIADQRYELVVGEYPRRAFVGSNEVSDKSDAIVSDKVDGSLLSMEHKSTGDSVDVSEFAMKKRVDPQFMQHTYVCRANGYNVNGVLLNAIQINKIPDPTTRKCGKPPEHKGIEQRYCWPKHVHFGMYPLIYTYDEIGIWKANAERGLHKYSELLSNPSLVIVNQEGIIGGRCGQCDYRRFCHESSRMNFTLLEPKAVKDSEDIIHSGVVND